MPRIENDQARWKFRFHVPSRQSIFEEISEQSNDAELFGGGPYVQYPGNDSESRKARLHAIEIKTNEIKAIVEPHAKAHKRAQQADERFRALQGKAAGARGNIWLTVPQVDTKLADAEAEKRLAEAEVISTNAALPQWLQETH